MVLWDYAIQRKVKTESFKKGGAGAPTGFARTVPMKGRAVVSGRHDERE